MTMYKDREHCYKCYRPMSSCMCSHVHKIETKTKFVILMHPKEFKKTKNGTGRLTHLALPNSSLFIGIDFTNHIEMNKIIKTHNSFILYPSKNAINFTHNNITCSKSKPIAIFIIDSTWACSNKILQMSKNLSTLQHISFSNTKLSQFKIKEQPKNYCLSTIESTQSVLELLDKWDIEEIKHEKLEKFLNPFYKMIEYQLKVIDSNSNLRYKIKDVTI